MRADEYELVSAGVSGHCEFVSAKTGTLASCYMATTPPRRYGGEARLEELRLVRLRSGLKRFEIEA